MGYTHGIKWTEELIEEKLMEVANTFDPVRMPSLAEIRRHYGDNALKSQLCRTGGVYRWAEKLGLEVKHSETLLGVQTEKQVAKILTRLGYEVEETPIRHPYDLLINGCVKVDVKAANISYIRGSKIRAYRLAKRQHTCDIYLFCEIDDNKISNVYVVPASAVTNQVQVEMGTFKTIYEKYRDRYDLIQKTIDFYKSLEVGA